ncbi:MAG: hypothetical protein R6V06_00750 [Kiritimatiellia bacterium]
MSLYVHFGAGNIGRALAGPIFSRAGYEVVFVDAFQPVVNALHERGSYCIVVKDDLPPGQPDKIKVSRVDAISVNDADALRDVVCKADLVGTAVGAAHVSSVLKCMLPGIVARGDRPLSILFCENFNGVSDFAKKFLESALPEDFLLKERIGFVETSIGKMVPIMPDTIRQEDPLLVWTEAYNKIIADRNGFAGFVPENIQGLELKDCFQAYVERKLYIHNLGHAACACHGFLKGYSLICDAVRDETICDLTRRVMMECASALTKRWPSEFHAENQREYVEDLIKRFGNRGLGDTIFRVGKDLFRKLSSGDRYIGALQLVQEAGGDCKPVYQAIAAALKFKAVDENGNMFPADDSFHKRLAKEGVEHVLQDHCGLSICESQKVSSFY